MFWSLVIVALSVHRVPSPVPPCPELRHFPTAEGYKSQLELNRQFQEWAVAQADLQNWHQDYYYFLLDEARRWREHYHLLHQVRYRWECFIETEQDHTWFAYRAAAYVSVLESFRRTIGHEAFVLGDLGPPIPLYALAPGEWIAGLQPNGEMK